MAFTVTTADLAARYDVRTLESLASDDGTPATGDYLAASTIATTAISSAVGQVKASLKKGERYTSEELDNLTDDALAFLKDITCAIAWWNLWRRKPAEESEEYQRKEARETAEAYLQQLRNGEITLDVAAAQDAGLPGVAETTNNRAAGIAAINRMGMYSNEARGKGRFYPLRRIQY